MPCHSRAAATDTSAVLDEKRAAYTSEGTLNHFIIHDDLSDMR